MKVLDETTRDLSKLIAADFGRCTEKEVRSHLLDWLHYKARNIPPLPRKLLVSDEVVAHSKTIPSIERICENLRYGVEMSPWLSNRIRLQKANHRADLMFNDWQIAHFHLGNIFETSSRIRRTAALLFAHITAEKVTLLDVQPHGSWSRTKLLEILLKTDPSAGYQLNGISVERLSDREYQNLRVNGVNSAIKIGGKVFMPGLGITSSGHALRIVNYEMWFWRHVDFLTKQIAANAVDTRLKSVFLSTIGMPVRLGAWYDPSGLTIIDKNRGNLVLHQMKPIE
ncbi:MAG: hypothetical protein LPK88_05855 [Alphaproteobacteria bacterium]|nr:hypothetical protein [Alphaproteobacteria bacterium]MDX5415829.1 hypothetical protein [Alphaproteobacteria bacterium]MDX5493110.1 hypothetical protein [Alphaproteobacteria bacterium]